MNFLEELEWRNMLHDKTEGVKEQLQNKKIIGYIGFDPTAPSLTIGNYVQIMLLKLFQRYGHKPIILMGGATGRVGDPSGKDKERPIKSDKDLRQNREKQESQIQKLIECDLENITPPYKNNKAIILNNAKFYQYKRFITFLRETGKYITISNMLNKESVKRRIDSGISFTEFTYQLIQGYDFVHLYNNYGCTLQMGGSDQFGNIVTGIELIRKLCQCKAHAITTPLLTKSDGKKFGKSEDGNIWLDPDMTSPYKFYQFWINMDDADTASFTRYFTLKSKAEIEAREKDLAEDPRELKRLLAEELTRRVHSDEDYESVLKVSELLFNRRANAENLMSLGDKELATVAKEIPSFSLSKDQFSNGINVLDLLADATQVVNSKGEARRAIKGNAISINKNKVASDDFQINQESLLHGKYLMVENGKKNKFMLIAE